MKVIEELFTQLVKHEITSDEFIAEVNTYLVRTAFFMLFTGVAIGGMVGYFFCLK